MLTGIFLNSRDSNSYFCRHSYFISPTSLASHQHSPSALCFSLAVKLSCQLMSSIRPSLCCSASLGPRRYCEIASPSLAQKSSNIKVLQKGPRLTPHLLNHAVIWQTPVRLLDFGYALKGINYCK